MIFTNIANRQHDLESILKEYWYYSIELAPGRITPGGHYPSVALTRSLLRGCGIEGMDCLDYGCMEGVVSAVMTQRGARRVAAVDVLDSSHKIDFVRQAYGNFEYYPYVRHDGVREFFWHQGQGQQMLAVQPVPKNVFDVVVCSGVLYHAYHPLMTIGHLRSLLRPGGLMIIETAVIPVGGCALHFNFTGEGFHYTFSDTWFFTPQLLDVVMRMFRLQPLDCFYFDLNPPGPTRMAVVARAVDHLPHHANEDLLAKFPLNIGYEDMVDFNYAADVRRMCGGPM